jgi:hypothetical protein
MPSSILQDWKLIEHMVLSKRLELLEISYNTVQINPKKQITWLSNPTNQTTNVKNKYIRIRALHNYFVNGLNQTIFKYNDEL